MKMNHAGKNQRKYKINFLAQRDQKISGKTGLKTSLSRIHTCSKALTHGFIEKHTGSD